MKQSAPQRVIIILNPAAGRGQARQHRAELEHLLDEAAAKANGASWSILETDRPGGAVALAAQAAKDGADVVAAAGGDGTYGEVVNGIVGTGARLGIVPLGTGNDFARCMGLGLDLQRAASTLFHGTPHAIDLGRARPTNASERWFINVAGCGFDAVVAQRVNDQRALPGWREVRGTAAYIAAIVSSLISFRAAKLQLQLDGERRSLRAMLCTVANAPSYGGGMRVAPRARIDDGWFDICLLGDVSRIEFLRTFPRVFRGTHISHPAVTMLRARQIRVESDPALPVLIDGDVMGTTPVEFDLVPHAIEVMRPVSPPRRQGAKERE